MTSRPMTYDVYMATPLEGSFEILNGVYYPRPGASSVHQQCVGNILFSMYPLVREQKIGHLLMAPCDVLIRKEPLQVRHPDVFLFSKEREKASGMLRDAPIPFGPELIIEVLEAWETTLSLKGKWEDLASVGTQEAWFVEPQNKILYQYRLTPEAERIGVYGGEDCITSLAFPALTITLAEFFEDDIEESE